MSIVSKADYDKYGGPTPQNNKLLKLKKPDPEYHFTWRIRKRWIGGQYYYSVERTEYWFFWLECIVLKLGEYEKCIEPHKNFRSYKLDSNDFGDERIIWFNSEEDAREAIDIYEEDYRIKIEHGEDKLIYVKQNET